MQLPVLSLTFFLSLTPSILCAPVSILTLSTTDIDIIRDPKERRDPAFDVTLPSHNVYKPIVAHTLQEKKREPEPKDISSLLAELRSKGKITTEG